MSPNKRQRSVSGDGGGNDHGDDAHHANKKIAHSREENSMPGPPRTAVDLADDPQDATADNVVQAILPSEERAQNSPDKLANDNDNFEIRLALLENWKNIMSQDFIKERDELQNKLNAARDQLITTLNKQQEEQQLLEAVQSKLESTSTQLDTVKANLESTKARCQRLFQDIEQIGIIRHNAPYLDSSLEEQFLELRDNIRWFTKIFCGRTIQVNSLPADLLVELRQLSSTSPSRFFRKGLYARRLVEAHIWCLLWENLLHDPFLIWGTTKKISQVVQHVLRRTSSPLPTRELWRVMTAQLLNDTEPHEGKVKVYRDLLISHITPFVNTDDRDNMERHIDNIINETVELAKCLTQSRTKCVIRRKEWDADGVVSQKYDSNWMEIIERGIKQNDTVELIVTPALIQLTNSAGDEFKPPRVLVKAEVFYGQGQNSDHSASVPNPPGGEIEQEALGLRRARVTPVCNKPAKEEALDELLGNDDDDHEVVDDTEDYEDESGEETIDVDEDDKKGSRRKKPSGNRKKPA